MTADKEFGIALYEMACEEHAEDEVLEGLCCVLDIMHNTPAYEKLLSNPALGKQERIALIESAFGNNIHRYAVNFIKILCERRALAMLGGCVREYREKLYSARGIMPVTAQSAVELTQQQVQRLTDKLAALTGKTIMLTTKVDATLIAGIRISYDGRMLDGTVKQRFDALQKALITA